MQNLSLFSAYQTVLPSPLLPGALSTAIYILQEINSPYKAYTLTGLLDGQSTSRSGRIDYANMSGRSRTCPAQVRQGITKKRRLGILRTSDCYKDSEACLPFELLVTCIMISRERLIMAHLPFAIKCLITFEQ